jgi:tRNA(Phe) wybutosine-synthesizing methylase Tyw3
VTKIINLYCEGMILHVHKDETDEMNLQSVARDFCFRETFLDNSARTGGLGFSIQDIGVLGQSPYEIWKI